MPVYQIRAEMPYDELFGWREYFNKYPPGWREDQRTMMILQAFGVKAKPEELFSSLATLKAQEVKRAEERKITLESFKRSGVFHFLSSSRELPNVLK